MTKIVFTEIDSHLIPAPRSSPSPETRLFDGIEEGRALAQHHLLDVRLQVFGSVTDAATTILRRSRGAATGTSVFTCNVDHMMLMKKNALFRAAYERADVVTIDGAPVALLSKWTGTADARRVTGVDLTEALAARAAHEGLRIALVGGAPGRGEVAAAELAARFPELPKMFVDSPRMGFALGDDEDMRLVRALQVYRPDIVIVCLGAPKQELWIDRHRADLAGAVLVGAGGTIDFLSGHQPRAPRLFQATGTEAAFRLVTDFRRLWRRYLIRDVGFLAQFALVFGSHIIAKSKASRSKRSHPAGLPTALGAPHQPCDACLHHVVLG